MNELTANVAVCNSPPKNGVATITLPNYQCTINLILPCGKIVEIKYNTEHPALDIEFPEDLIVTNWQSDMIPAAMVTGLSNDMKGMEQFAPGHVRNTKMLNVNLKPEYLIDERNN